MYEEKSISEEAIHVRFSAADVFSLISINIPPKDEQRINITHHSSESEVTHVKMAYLSFTVKSCYELKSTS